MRNTILFLIFLILSFSINIIFYYVSEDYRTFLKNLKNEDNIINLESNIKVSDDFFINDNKEKEEEKEIETEVINSEIINNNSLDNLTIVESKKDNNLNTGEVSLGRNYRDILDLFSLYNLEELELNTNLFDLTDEYPDKYIEYYSKDLTLYFFPTRKYSDLKDIFRVLESELPFTINEINNFGDNSFFINLNDDINDNIIRLIVSNKGIVFGLKIRKNDYNLIRDKLNTLRNN